MSSAYQMLIQIKEQQENYKEVYLISKSFEGVQDSIANFQKQTEILDLQYKYQSQHKDDQITLLSQENQLQSFKISRSRLLLFAVIAISILLLLILILFLRQNGIKSARKVAEFKQRLLRSQMNPHFIFNSLTSVQNLILQKDEIKASVYLSRFSDLVRNILKHSQVELISLEEEISTVENYLELQKIRFPERFDYIINLDEQLNPENISVPPMLAQPFIENAIEHAFKRLDTKGHIIVSILKKSDSFIMEIKDNGIGRQKAQALRNHLEKDHKPMATLITKERIKTINKKIKKEIYFDIIDLKDDLGKATGTKIIFQIPLSLYN
jgi:LytS/YehU family sensor histidine kinase